MIPRITRFERSRGRLAFVRRLRLIGLLAAFIAIATVAVHPPIAAEAPQQTIAASLRPFVENHTLAGAVTLVASPDRVLSLEAVGYMDIARKRPMRTDALFWIASQSKAMTASALMMLVDEGKVNVDDPVEKYLPEFKGQWVKGPRGLFQVPA